MIEIFHAEVIFYY